MNISALVSKIFYDKYAYVAFEKIMRNDIAVKMLIRREENKYRYEDRKRINCKCRTNQFRIKFV